jgi:hypothetical protein
MKSFPQKWPEHNLKEELNVSWLFNGILYCTRPPSLLQNAKTENTQYAGQVPSIIIIIIIQVQISHKDLISLP